MTIGTGGRVPDQPRRGGWRRVKMNMRDLVTREVMNKTREVRG
jgi:hypothetical protein